MTEEEDLRSKAIKKLEEYTIEEKCDAFDKIYASAVSDFEDAEKQKEPSTHWAWEAQMKLMARNNSLFWKLYNSFN